MKAGKLSQTVWRRAVEKQLNKEEKRVTVPAPAENCMAVRVDAKTLDMSCGNSQGSTEGLIELSTAASVFGTTEKICVYALAKALNDLAARGGKLQGISAQLMLPTEAEEADVKRIVQTLQKLCTQKEIPILGLQAEVNPAVSQQFVQIIAMGSGKETEMLTARNIKPGEEIILCGTIGLEGILRILDEREEELSKRFVPAFIRQIKELQRQLFLDEAIEAAKEFSNDKDTFAVQQIGSGGIFAALWEMAEEAGVGLEIDLNKIAIRQETVEICEYYQLNPYQMTSTGGVLMVTEDGAGLIKALEKVGAGAVRLGVTTAENARVITSGTEKRYMDRPAPDEWMRWYMQEFRKGQ